MAKVKIVRNTAIQKLSPTGQAKVVESALSSLNRKGKVSWQKNQKKS